MNYLDIARRYIGVKEIHGPQHNTVIQGWLTNLKAWWVDDETPWCGVFVAACLQQAGLPFPKNYFRAKAYLDFGYPASIHDLGAIAVISRDGGGHVAFVTGFTSDGRYVRLLGGNQGDKVCEAWFEASRVVDARRPTNALLLSPAPIAKRGEMSPSED